MILTQPFPGYSSFSKIVRFTAAAGFVVFLILYLFRPFNIDWPGNHFSIWHAAIYGLGTFVNTTLNGLLLPFLFPVFFTEQRWNVAKEMLLMMWQVMSTAFVNLVITHYLYGIHFTFPHLVQFLFITAAIGIFPVTLIILLKQQILFRKYVSRAAELEVKLEQQEAVEPEIQAAPVVQAAAALTLTGDNQSESVSMPVDDLRFISAADNYIRVHYLLSEKPAQKVLRSTLKKAETALSDHPQLFRCHRAYIVNLAAVSHISGNAQGFKLHLQGAEETIPVSRSLNNDIPELLSRYSPGFQ